MARTTKPSSTLLEDEEELVKKANAYFNGFARFTMGLEVPKTHTQDFIEIYDYFYEKKHLGPIK
jgi:hypothetical protein